MTIKFRELLKESSPNFKGLDSFLDFTTPHYKKLQDRCSRRICVDKNPPKIAVEIIILEDMKNEPDFYNKLVSLGYEVFDEIDVITG